MLQIVPDLINKNTQVNTSVNTRVNLWTEVFTTKGVMAFLSYCKNVFVGKNAHMPKERSRDHSPETVAHTLKRLDELKARILASQMAMEAAQLGPVNVPREPSREQGITRLSAWADALRDSVDAMMDAKLGSNGAVSVSLAKADKPRKK